MKTRGFDCVDRQYANRYKRILTTTNYIINQINWGKSVIRPSAPPCRSSASYSIDFHLSPFSLCRQPALFIPPAALLTFVCSFYLCLISPSLWNLSIGQLATIPSSHDVPSSGYFKGSQMWKQLTVAKLVESWRRYPSWSALVVGAVSWGPHTSPALWNRRWTTWICQVPAL